MSNGFQRRANVRFAVLLFPRLAAWLVNKGGVDWPRRFGTWLPLAPVLVRGVVTEKAAGVTGLARLHFVKQLLNCRRKSAPPLSQAL